MALPARPISPSNTAETISTLLGGYTIEATFPKEAEIEELKRTVPAGTRIYLSCLPNRLPEKLVDSAAAIRRAGFEPVPHITARAYPDRASLDNVLAGLGREASVREVLVIAGDRDEPAGPYAGALDLIESGAIEGNGISTINISGYPDGHPKIDHALLHSILPRKLEAAAKRNLAVNITTQFCLDPEQILTWLRDVRGQGITVPIRVGVAGPTTMRALMKFALRCGVRASLKGVFNPKALQLFGDANPDPIIRALAETGDREQLGPLNIHFFSFGGIVNTAEWAESVAQGKIRPTNEGFVVLK